MTSSSQASAHTDSHGQPAEGGFFDEETRQQLAQDDSDAWGSVTGLLLFIVLVGVSIAVFAVTICFNTQF